MTQDKVVTSIKNLANKSLDASSLRLSAQVKWLDTRAIPFIDKKIAEVSGENKTASKRFLEKIKNLALSYKEGGEDGEAGNKPLVGFNKDVEAALDDFKVKPSKKTTAKEEDDEDKDAKNLHEYDAATVKALNQYAKFKLMLPSNISKLFVSLRMPLLVVTKGGMHLDKLKSQGFSKDNIFGYPVLLNQLVIGFNHTKFSETYKGDWDEAAEDIIEKIYIKTKRRFIMLSKPVKYKNVFYIWLAEEKDVSALNKASFGSHFIITKWSFPFRGTLVK